MQHIFCNIKKKLRENYFEIFGYKILISQHDCRNVDIYDL